MEVHSGMDCLEARIKMNITHLRLCDKCGKSYEGFNCPCTHQTKQLQEIWTTSNPTPPTPKIEHMPAVRVDIDLLLKLYGESYKHDPISEVTESVKNRIIDGFRELEEMAFK